MTKINIEGNGLTKIMGKSLSKVYDSGDLNSISIMNIEEYRKWVNGLGPHVELGVLFKLHGGTVDICKEVLGYQSFCWTGESRYYCYLLEYRKVLDGREAIGYFHYMSTDSDKGSTMEFIVEYNGVKTDKRLVKPFMDMFVNLLQNGETILKRNQSLDKLI